MALMRPRTAALRRGTITRTMLLLALVGGVLVGLLAMHTVSSASGGHSESTSAMSSDMATHGDHGDMVAPPAAEMPADCSGMCDPGHIMSSMTCVLVLLFTGLVLAITASRRWSMIFAALRTRWLAIVAVAVAAMPPPPDLNALSISRT
jgi:hypothetical protein